MYIIDIDNSKKIYIEKYLTIRHYILNYYI